MAGQDETVLKITADVKSVVEGLSKVVDQLTSLLQAFEKMSQAAAPAAQKTASAFEQLWSTITDGFGDVKAALDNVDFVPITSQWATAFQSMASSVHETVSSLPEMLSTVWGQIQTGAASATTLITTTIPDAFKSMGTAVKTAVASVPQVLDRMWTSIKNGANLNSVLTAIPKAFAAMSSGISKAVGVLPKMIDGVWHAVKQGAAVVQSVGSTVQRGIQTMANGIVSAIGKLPNLFDSLWAKITGGVTVGNLLSEYLTRAFDAIVQGAKDAITAIPKLVDHVANLGDQFQTLSQQTGVSVEAISQWEFVGQQAGVSLQQMTRAAQTMGLQLQKASTETKAALAKIGLSLKDLQKSTPEKAFVDFFESLKKNAKSAAETLSVGTAVMGRQFRQFSQLAKEDIRSLMEEADKLGLTMTAQAAALGDAYNDAKNRLAMTFEGIKRSIGTAFLPVFTALIQTLQERLFKLFTSLGLSAKNWGDQMNDVLRSVAIAIGGIVETVGPLLADFTNLVISLGEALAPTVRMLADAISKSLKFYALFEVNKAKADLMTTAAATIDSTLAAADKVGEAFAKLKPKIDGFLSSIKDSTAGFTSDFIAKFDKILADLKTPIEDVAGEIGEGISPAQQALQSYLQTVEALEQQITLAVAAGRTWPQLLEAFGDSAYKAFNAAKQIPGALKAISEGGQQASARILSLAGEMERAFTKERAETFVKIFKKGLGDQIQNTVRSEGLKRWLDDIQKITTVWKDEKEKRELLNKEEEEQQLILLDRRREEFFKTLDQIKDKSSIFYRETRQMAEDRFNHERDEILKTDATLVDRLKKQGIYTQAEYKKRAAEAKAMYEQMVAYNERFGKSVGYSTEQLEAARLEMERLNNLAKGAPNLFGKWTKALDSVVDGFEQLANIAGESFATITRGVGTMLGSIKQLKGAFDIMKDAKKAKGGIDWAGMVVGMMSFVGAIAQAVQGAIALGKALKDAFSRSEAEKSAADIRRSGFDEDLANIAEDDPIAKRMEELVKQGIDRNTALELQLSELINRAGGVDEGNFVAFRNRADELFDDVAQGGKVGKMALQEIDKVMGQLGQHVQKVGGLWDKEFTRMIGRGKELASVQQLIASEVAKIGPSVAKVADGFQFTLGKAFSSLKPGFTEEEYTTLWERLEEAQSGATKAMDAEDQKRYDNAKRTSKDLQALMEKEAAARSKATGKKVDPSAALLSPADQKRLKESEATYNELRDAAVRAADGASKAMTAAEQKRWEAAQAANAKIVADYQTEFDRISRITLASFNAQIKNGVNFIDAIKNIGPAIDDLIASTDRFGFAGNAAYEELSRLRNLTTFNAPLLESVGSLNELMVTLSNLGALNAETFADMQAQATTMFTQMTEAGFTSQEALMQLAPTLETIQQLQKEQNMVVDEGTQALIDQAEAAGLLAEQKSEQEILTQGFKDMTGAINILSAVLGKAFGVEIPKAIDATTKAASGLKGTFAGLEGQLADGDFTSWAGDLEAAAKDAQYAVDGVSMGHSPGGIKDIPIWLAKSQRAASIWEQQFVDAMQQAQLAVDAVASDVNPTSIFSIPEARDIENAMQAFDNIQQQQSLSAQEKLDRMVSDRKFNEPPVNVTLQNTFEYKGPDGDGFRRMIRSPDFQREYLASLKDNPSDWTRKLREALG